jgi:hypothetical protein
MTTMPVGTSIQPLQQRERDRTAAAQITDDVILLRATTAEVRDQANSLANQASVLHDRVQQFDLDDRTMTLSQNDLTDLLNSLGDDLGLPWSVIAELVGVSTTAVRKWRRGGEITHERRARLARLLAFCSIVPKLDPRIDDIARWLQTPLIVGASTLTPADLFVRNAEIPLLNRVADRTKSEELLDRILPDWRDTTRPDNRHQVVMASDGVPSIVPVD